MPRAGKFKAGEIVRGVTLLKKYTVRKPDNRNKSVWKCVHNISQEIMHIDEANLMQSKCDRKSKLGTQINRTFNNYRYKCRKKNLFWDLSSEQFYTLTQKPCVYCGIAPSNGRLPFIYNGLDRKDNNLGYTPDNVAPCCARCNGIKGDILSYEDMKIAMRAIKKAHK